MTVFIIVELASFPSLSEFIKAHVELVTGGILLHLTVFFFGKRTTLREFVIYYR